MIHRNKETFQFSVCQNIKLYIMLKKKQISQNLTEILRYSEMHSVSVMNINPNEMCTPIPFKSTRVNKLIPNVSDDKL